MARDDPSIPPPGDRCVFLSLPAELRYIVYEYALTEERGLICVASADSALPLKLYFSQENGRDCRAAEANQLKSVCRQLYRETRGLAPGLNDLAFRSGDAMSGIELFEHFVQSCPEAAKTIKEDSHLPGGGYEGLHAGYY
ncbi:hypothetical protein BU26DRAFT_86821 [Trematosphaeria pertusa]|uniref:F-box domain-containing protein n=1 Tax=Trematosphaeria pertusa TaxID=390896 RepID=A0A6A6I3Q0_9PLEO|nr:uncharacterized protein BU26DRAFT_86821 [Trematosphaeria pertusa]KAF2244799.1 hypothetical protein BU26DRAFT_86821 [Trematosphaeria pertusa]